MAFLYFDYCLLFFGEIMETKMITFGEKTDNYPFATSLASSVATWVWVSPLKWCCGNSIKDYLKVILRKWWIQCEKVCPVSPVKVDIIWYLKVMWVWGNGIMIYDVLYLVYGQLCHERYIPRALPKLVEIF